MLTLFLSEENVAMQEEYLNGLSLQKNIFEKSYQGLSEGKVRGIRPEERGEYARLCSEIALRRIWRDSFAERSTCARIPFYNYPSTSSFLYAVKERMMGMTDGFVIIYTKGEKAVLSDGRDWKNAVLAINVNEHAYFYDYGFHKEEYADRTLRFLNLKKLEKQG